MNHLQPVRRVLLADARDESERVLAAAAADAEALRASAQERSESEVAAAHRRGELAAQALADRILTGARNDAHTTVLRAQERSRIELVESVHSAALEIRDDPRYPELLDRLEALARSQLGADADAERDPSTGGGIIATAGHRRVDYTLGALADRALDVISDEVTRLWM